MCMQSCLETIYEVLWTCHHKSLPKSSLLNLGAQAGKLPNGGRRQDTLVETV